MKKAKRRALVWLALLVLGSFAIAALPGFAYAQTLIADDGKTVRISVLVRDTDSRRFLEIAQEAERLIAQLPSSGDAAKDLEYFTPPGVRPSNTFSKVALAHTDRQIYISGQYARVRAAVDTKAGAILVPQRSVSELQGIYNVAVVGANDTVEMRMVKPAERIGNLWVIDSGLNPGERIVVEGLQKVRPGVTVKPEMVTIEESGGTAPGAAPASAVDAAKGGRD